jgi:hypothetical protein
MFGSQSLTLEMFYSHRVIQSKWWLCGKARCRERSGFAREHLISYGSSLHTRDRDYISGSLRCASWRQHIRPSLSRFLPLFDHWRLHCPRTLTRYLNQDSRLGSVQGSELLSGANQHCCSGIGNSQADKRQHHNGVRQALNFQRCISDF